MQGIPATFNGKQHRFVWEYLGPDSEGYVARYDGEGKKDVVPYFNRVNGHGWKTGVADAARPLFGLQMLVQADLNDDVFVVEGEKAAAALQSLGLAAVTSQGGSCASGKTDWRLWKGIGAFSSFQTRMPPGEAYARATAAILQGLENRLMY